MSTCKGMNCHSRDGKHHSAECILEAAKTQSWEGDALAIAARLFLELREKKEVWTDPLKLMNGDEVEILNISGVQCDKSLLKVGMRGIVIDVWEKSMYCLVHFNEFIGGIKLPSFMRQSGLKNGHAAVFHTSGMQLQVVSEVEG